MRGTCRIIIHSGEVTVAVRGTIDYSPSQRRGNLNRAVRRGVFDLPCSVCA